MYKAHRACLEQGLLRKRLVTRCRGRMMRVCMTHPHRRRVTKGQKTDESGDAKTAINLQKDRQDQYSLTVALCLFPARPAFSVLGMSLTRTDNMRAKKRLASKKLLSIEFIEVHSKASHKGGRLLKLHGPDSLFDGLQRGCHRLKNPRKALFFPGRMGALMVRVAGNQRHGQRGF